MSQRHEDDPTKSATDAPESKRKGDPEPVAPEAGEGPIPPLTGHPRPPIGN